MRVRCMYKKSKNGFTLAEVLITLGVIGVVSAITMPTLIQKHQEHVTVVKVKKFYSTMAQAYESYINEYGYPDSWEKFSTREEATTNFANKFKPYLKIIKDCGYNEGCFINGNYKKFNGTESINFVTNKYMLILNDGSAVAFYLYSKNNDNNCIYYDINGKKGPNQFGKDMFEFDFDNKLVPGEYFDPSNTEENTLTNCLVGGYTCAHWIITNGNMDYLHCPDYLTENPTATKCPK